MNKLTTVYWRFFAAATRRSFAALASPRQTVVSLVHPLISNSSLEFPFALGNFLSRGNPSWQSGSALGWRNSSPQRHLNNLNLATLVDYDVNRITLSLAVGY
jgi:hypothetical protein